MSQKEINQLIFDELKSIHAKLDKVIAFHWKLIGGITVALFIFEQYRH